MRGAMWSTLEKIDRIIMTNDCEDLYYSCFLLAIGTTKSDNCPSLMDLHADFRMGRRFKFEIFWMKSEGFMDTVCLAWSSIPSMGNPFVVLHKKLCATTKWLQAWSDMWIGNVKI